MRKPPLPNDTNDGGRPVTVHVLHGGAHSSRGVRNQGYSPFPQTTATLLHVDTWAKYMVKFKKATAGDLDKQVTLSEFTRTSPRVGRIWKCSNLVPP